jgi:hypothetical protein
VRSSAERKEEIGKITLEHYSRFRSILPNDSSQFHEPEAETLAVAKQFHKNNSSESANAWNAERA